MANNTSSAIVSAVVGCVAAFVTCFVFFYFFYKPAPPIDAHQPNQNVASPAPTQNQELPNPEINAADVSSVSIKTVYKGYFEPGDKSAKNHNEFYGNDDGIGSPSSPCTIQVTFRRDGRASRSVEVRRWYKTAKDFQVVERSDSIATITPEQFDSLTQTVITNEAFRSWREGTEINISNCSITVVHNGGIKTPMSNVDENTPVFLQMINGFKELDKQLTWKKV